MRLPSRKGGGVDAIISVGISGRACNGGRDGSTLGSEGVRGTDGGDAAVGGRMIGTLGSVTVGVGDEVFFLWA